jgi:hypothetical protein
MRMTANWPKLVFVLAPILIVTADAFVLVRERLEPQAQKAIRLVKESNSRKENFNVQQYLYTTVYYRRDQGEAITIGGWRVADGSDADATIVVEFSYRDSTGEHLAIWQASLREGTVIAKNEGALELSWH